jgi:hypothetical protein
MLLNRKSTAPKRSVKIGKAMGVLVAGCAASSLALGVQAFSGEMASAAPSTMVLHYFQVQGPLNFYNASNVLVHGYPPLGGHIREDDIDYVGDKTSHAATWTVSDHLFCTVVKMPSTGQCFGEFAVGGSLIYADDFIVHLAAGAGAIHVDGGTGHFAGYTGTITETQLGKTNDSDVVITLHN